MFIFFFLDWKYSFCANFVQKNKFYFFKLKIGTDNNFELADFVSFHFYYFAMEMLFLSKLSPKTKTEPLSWYLPLRADWVQIIKTVSINWNLLLKLQYSNILKSMRTFNFSFLDRRYSRNTLFGKIWFAEPKLSF